MPAGWCAPRLRHQGDRLMGSVCGAESEAFTGWEPCVLSGWGPGAHRQALPFRLLNFPGKSGHGRVLLPLEPEKASVAPVPPQPPRRVRATLRRTHRSWRLAKPASRAMEARLSDGSGGVQCEQGGTWLFE